MTEQFLTVYAVLDAETQRVLGACGKALLDAGICGTQSPVPYHISLGSYPTTELEALLSRMARVSEITAPFPLRLTGLGDFGERVLFFQPEKSEGILRLRREFDNDYPKAFPYYPHCTLLIDEPERVREARKIAEARFEAMEATVAGLEIGRFFPAERLRFVPFSGVPPHSLPNG